jgi:amidohydrolase
MAVDLISRIRQLSGQLHEEIVQIRRDLHQYPELSFQEQRTSSRVASYLGGLNIEFTDGWAGYGIVATIKGFQGGKKVMLRADMDALPIQEQSDVEYKSKNEGIMHACGHDVHTSSLLGTAAIIAQLKEEFAGEIIFLFQPGEEKLPGGASLMIGEGVLEKYSPDFIIAQHVFPSLPSGHAGYRSGMYMASADEIYIEIKGKGGHAATPHVCIDPIVMASRVILQLQEVISRYRDPVSPAVLTIGKIYSDG